MLAHHVLRRAALALFSTAKSHCLDIHAHKTCRYGSTDYGFWFTGAGFSKYPLRFRWFFNEGVQIKNSESKMEKSGSSSRSLFVGKLRNSEESRKNFGRVHWNDLIQTSLVMQTLPVVISSRPPQVTTPPTWFTIIKGSMWGKRDQSWSLFTCERVEFDRILLNKINFAN